MPHTSDLRDGQRKQYGWGGMLQSGLAVALLCMVFVGHTASNNCGTRSSPGFIQSGRDSFAGRDFALFFATDTYDTPSWRRLSSPVRDAREIASDLERFYHFSTEIVVNPTRAQVFDKLIEYATRKSFRPDAQLLVFFSGHGCFDDLAQEGYIIPRDGKASNVDPYRDSWLRHTELRLRINRIPCPHILLALDACFSGAVSPPGNKGEDPDSIDRPNEDSLLRRKRITDMLNFRTRLFITSGGKNYTPDPSEFAAEFKRGLRSLGGPDGLLDIYELYYNYLAKIATQPQFGAFEGNETGSYFLFDYRRPGPPSIPDLPGDRDGDHVPDTADACPDVWADTRSGCPEQPIPVMMISIQADTSRLLPERIPDTSWQPAYDYFLSRKPVTFEQYYAYCASSKTPKPEKTKPGLTGQAVTNVNWIDAVKFCNWLSKQEDRTPFYTLGGNEVMVNGQADGYRLPTVEELTYAIQHVGPFMEADGTIWEWCWNTPTAPASPYSRVLIQCNLSKKMDHKAPVNKMSNPFLGRSGAFGFRLARNGADE